MTGVRNIRGNRMLKLTQLEAVKVLIEAEKDKAEYPQLRSGQSVWNNIPNEYLLQYVANDYGYDREVDFFEETDYDIVLNKFFKYFVEE